VGADKLELEFAIRNGSVSVDSGWVRRHKLCICSRLGRWVNFVGGILWGMSILAFAVRRRSEAGNRALPTRTLIQEK
jgi:hypothetical protein